MKKNQNDFACTQNAGPPLQVPVCVKLDVTPEVRCALSKEPPGSEKLCQEITLPTEPSK